MQQWSSDPDIEVESVTQFANLYPSHGHHSPLLVFHLTLMFCLETYITADKTYFTLFYQLDTLSFPHYTL